METVLSGMRASGKLHLGNYFGAAQNFVKMQYDYSCYYFIADWHTLTTDHDPFRLQRYVKEVLVDYLACGLDPEHCTIYLQSEVPEIAELYLYLNMFAYKGELEKTASFKEKARKKGQTLNAGLLTYPALMAADILIHRASKVPVGKDQEQHLEMTRNLANRFNSTYDTDFLPEPVAFNYGKRLVKILNLDGSGKMSKSDENERNIIFLRDSADDIMQKVKRAKTDSGPAEKNSIPPPEIENLFNLLELVAPQAVYNTYTGAYADCSIRYGDLKKTLAEHIAEYLAPIQEKIQQLSGQNDYLREVTHEGAKKARKSARETIEGIQEIIGLHYFT